MTRKNIAYKADRLDSTLATVDHGISLVKITRSDRTKVPICWLDRRGVFSIAKGEEEVGVGGGRGFIEDSLISRKEPIYINIYKYT
jgi:hypothetical protein